MTARYRAASVIAIVALAITAAFVPQTAAQCFSTTTPILYGTTGACNNVNQGGACTQTSTLVQLDPWTGALVKVIGPVGYTVNGLAWDPIKKTLFATTALGDVAFHGLITIDPKTGAGTPVNPKVVNFGLALSSRGEAPVHSITIDSRGNIVGWYDEFAPPADVSDTFVRLNKKTGIATEFPNTGINSSQNGVSFSDLNILWNIDSPKAGTDGSLTQTAYLLNPLNGKPLLTRSLTPPIAAALGDFHPVNNLYYGLNFESFSGSTSSTIMVVDLLKGTTSPLASTVDNLHTLAFVKQR